MLGSWGCENSEICPQQFAKIEPRENIWKIQVAHGC